MGIEDISTELIDVAIIGGGASGMAAAIFAKRTFLHQNNRNSIVKIFEKNERVGKKLLMTGNGRCNLTNLDTDMTHFHGSDVRFSKGALLSYPPEKIMSFFEEIGLICTVEEDQKVYPLSLHAASVLDSLRLTLDELKIPIQSGSMIKSINKKGKLYELILTDNSKISAVSVVVATGGMCAPSTGSDGNGYGLFKDYFVRKITPLPSIVQLKTDTKFCKPLSGNKIFGKASLRIDGETIRFESGEILFTDYGLSGPPILQLSGYVSRALATVTNKASEKNIEIYLDFLPGFSEDKVLAMICARKKAFPERRIDEFLTGLFQKRLAIGLMREITDKPMTTYVNELSGVEMERLATKCKSMKIKVYGTMPFGNAQTTAGGLDTTYFDPSTLSLKSERGLYACGEILDIDGDCGGFNLQWAWASGFLAGSSAAEYVISEKNNET